MKITSALRLLMVAILTLAVHATYAQFGAGLTGTVSDQSGGAIPNATVTLTNEATKIAVTRSTNASGLYIFPSLPGGTYDLAVTATGFKPQTLQAVDVSSNQVRNFDVSLTLGGNNETVTVNASDVVALQTSNASVSSTLDSEQFEKIPTYGRDPYNLVRTAVGITGDGSRAGNGSAVFLPNSVGPGGSNFGVAATENTVQISADGQRIADNNFLVDGVSVNSLGYGGATVINPNIEAISSLQTISTSFSAEDGRNTGAQVKITTKSGTDHLHGSLFFVYDEPGLNAYNKYGGVTVAGVTPKSIRVSTKSRDYGGSLGGPIIKDKLFAFGSFEGINQKLDSFPDDFIETPQFRAAIHTQRAGSIADQIANAPGGVPTVRQVLGQSCASPVNQASVCQVVAGGLDLGRPVPLAANGGSGYASFNVANQINLGGTTGTTAEFDGIPDIEYVQLDSSQLSNAQQYNGRVDYYMTPKDQFAGSAYVTKLHRLTPSDTARPNQTLPFDPTNIATTFIYIHTFTPNVLNELRANYTLFSENGVYDAQKSGVDLGIPFIELQNSAYTGNNRIHFGANAGTTSPGIFAENQYEVRDTVTYIRGSHTTKIGAEFRWEQDNNNLVGGSRPTYTFAGIWNFFNDRPIYEGVSANPATGGQAQVSRHLDDHYVAGFIQHDWRVNSALTINAGLRYEYFGPLYNKGFAINYPRLGTTPGRELVDSVLTPRADLWNPNYNDFSPKVGFAYSLDTKTVLRGGFAMAYNRLDDVLFDPALEDGPGVFSYGICCGTAPQDFGSPFVNGEIIYQRGSSTAYNSFAANPALKTPIGANGLPTNGITVEGYGATPQLKQPMSYLYSLEMQRNLGRDFVLSVGYQGSTGRHYARLVNQNFISPNSVTTGTVTTNSPFFALYLAHDDSNLYYNALNVHATKSYKSGLSLDARYTYSKAEDQVSSGDGADGSANQTFPQDNTTELGPGDFDTRNLVVVAGTYDMHLYHGESKLKEAAYNGWQINGIFTAHTGFPWTPVTYSINGLQTVANTAVQSPVRPTSFVGTQNDSCSADVFRNGQEITGVFGFGYRKVVSTGVGTYGYTNTDASGNAVGGYRPGIGRNSFRGPCYQQLDAGVGKEFRTDWLREGTRFRIQVQAFNVFNKLNFSPYTFNTSSTQIDSGANVTQLPTPSAANLGSVYAVNATVVPGQGTFQKPISGTAGRVLELTAHFQF
jgi:hypothetical protein